MISYQCIAGYHMFGQANLRCLGSGKWSRMNGRCSSAFKNNIQLQRFINVFSFKSHYWFLEISCGKPQLQQGIVLHGRSYLFQDQLTYVCPDGKKQGMITCRADGKWNELPKCNWSKNMSLLCIVKDLAKCFAIAHSKTTFCNDTHTYIYVYIPFISFSNLSYQEFTNVMYRKYN